LSYTEDTLATVLVEALLEKPSRVVVHSFRGQNKLGKLDIVALPENGVRQLRSLWTRHLRRRSGDEAARFSTLKYPDSHGRWRRR
jgi:hypothetical protein